VRLREGFALTLFRLLAVIPSMLALLFILAAGGDTLLIIGYGLFGENLSGKVAAKIEEPVDKGPRYFVEVAYTADSRDFNRRIPVRKAVYASMNEGDPVNLSVLPWARDSARMAPVGGHYPVLAILCSWAVSIPVILIAVMWLRHVFWLPWTQRRLLRFGTATTGTVRNIESGEGKGGRWYRVRYDYQPAGRDSAQSFSGDMTGNGTDAKEMKVGDAVTVVYDSVRPHLSVLYRLSHYEVVAP
jgi:hypothetical protein